MYGFSLLILLAFLVGYFISIPLLIQAAKEKGHYPNGGTGMLWAVGILASPVVLGLYVCALPDMHLWKFAAANGNSTATSATEQDELPSI
ncbi:hypothetical protein [Olsenella intestinalis]|uniref:hypothetical protein n=1 Tax=Olsenella intestinalis TaxID=2930083 RepID=UPI00200F88F1|nr:hypothetical protein [Olsenella intestinalis]